MFRLILCITFLLCSSCSTMYEDFISLPIQDDIEYYIFIDENNSVQKVSDSSDILLAKNRLTPVLAYANDIDEKPRGFVYPYSETLDAYGGFSAWILYKLLVCSNEESEKVHHYLSHFNWNRFLELISKYEDPWKLNQDLIFENISDRTFNVYSIKENVTIHGL